jgi:hypothetical protein
MICPSCQAENEAGALGCCRCSKALPQLVPGDVVGERFEILSLLGTGSLGVVFKATDRTLDEIVALKTLRGDLDDADQIESRFRSKIRLARRVSSRHVCRIHEYGVDGSLHYVTMEHVDGVTLKDLLHETGGLPADVALDIAAQLLAGLTVIHDAGIMHRDIKPSNLMRTRDGLIKLMDFGIAREIGGLTLTVAGRPVGTPEYMSPEQLTGEKLDPRTDLYTTGIVVFELLTGIPPFRGKTLVDTAHKQVTEQPDLQTPGIPAELAPVLGRALAKNRDARFGSAHELGEALAQVRRDLVAAAAPTPPASGRPSMAHSRAMAALPVTAMIRALRSGDPSARLEAVLALADLGPPSSAAVWALADALKDPDGRVRRMAAAALGRMGPAAEPAIPALLRALDDESLGDEAAGSLVEIGTAAVPALLEVMKSEQEWIRWHAATALTRIGAGLGKPPSRAC